MLPISRAVPKCESGIRFVTRSTRVQGCASCPASGLPSVSLLVRHAARGTTESVSLRLASTLKLRCPVIGSFVCSSATRSALPFLPISLAIASTRVASFELWRACGFCCCLVSAYPERGISQSAVSKELQGVMVEARVHTPPPQPSAKYSSQRSFPRPLVTAWTLRKSGSFDRSDAPYISWCGAASVASLPEDAAPCRQARNATRQVTDRLNVSTVPLSIGQRG